MICMLSTVDHQLLLLDRRCDVSRREFFFFDTVAIFVILGLP